MSYLDVSSPENIWKNNPQLRTLKKATEFFEANGEEWFNKVYYAVYLVYDPLSPMRKTSNDEKQIKAEVKTTFFTTEEQSKLNWVYIRTLAAEYKRKSLTKEQRRLDNLDKKLESAQKLVDKFKPEEFDKEGLKGISELKTGLKDMVDIWKMYSDLKKQIKEDNKQSNKRYGGGQGNIWG